MPNHAHVVIEIVTENSLSDIVGSWKSFTAKSWPRSSCPRMAMEFGAFRSDMSGRDARGPRHERTWRSAVQKKVQQIIASP